MFEIGLTGGIGSGKSTVANIFKTIGYAVYDADTRAKAMYADPEVETRVRALFGDSVYAESGKLNRKVLAGIVFSDRALLEKLNAIIHPATLKDFENWRDNLLPNYEKPFLLKEAAILLETGSYKEMDAVITIYAPQELRISRVAGRDGATRAETLARMNNQWPDSRKMEAADFVIYSDGEHPLIPQVMEAICFFSKPENYQNKPFS